MRQVDQVKNGARFIKDTSHRVMHDRCLWNARMRRDQTAERIPEWEELRTLASDIKRHTLTHLDEYLTEFEKNATAHGIHIHWAQDAEEHNRIILGLMKSHNVKIVTKSKSMTMDECDIRPFLEKNGISVYEADLGERIQQLDNQPPSHIVLPAIQKLRQDVARLFAEKLGSDPNDDDPHYLNSVMRADMRKNYIKVDCGMNGVNYAIAETGGVVVCTNEGNADISANVPPLFILSMGLEKVIPTVKDLSVFIRLLSRSALGLDITQYTTHYHGPRPGQEMHIVILDNGRSARLASPDYWEVLKCIRCGACMNTCPVYRRTGGLSYECVYMGPIGLALEPSYNLYRYARLPYSCTHCGSCGDVCPVKVPIPELIFYWRNEVVSKRYDQLFHRIEEEGMEFVLKNAGTLSACEKLGLWALRNIPPSIAQCSLNPWAYGHDNPIAPAETFRQWFKKEGRHETEQPDNSETGTDKTKS